MEVLIFDIWGDLAHFKKFYTTSSPLTFSIPPVTALTGLVGCILGWSKKDNLYLDLANKAGLKFAIQIRRPIEKTRLGLNWIDTKDAGRHFNQIKQRTQVLAEFVRNPAYRIYLSCQDDKTYAKLAHAVAEHKTVYTPCLGLSECLAQFKFYKRVPFKEKKSAAEVNIATVVPFKFVQQPIFEEGKSYSREQLPIIMNQEREVKQYEEVLFEPSGKPLKVILKAPYYEAESTNIVFLH